MTKYRFRLNQNEWYNHNEFNDFIINNIRPIFGAGGETSTICIEQTNSRNIDIAQLTIRHSDLYLTKFSGINIPGNLINYGEDDFRMNQNEIHSAFDAVREFSGTVQNNTGKSVKVMAFLFSEAARFSIVNYAVTKIMRDYAAYRWNDFRDIVRNWQVLSRHAIDNHLVPNDARQHDGKIVPVEPNIILDYNRNNQVGLRIPKKVGM
ncbi:MAG: hypothetical protein D3922_03770 [Candidatus Electrothrix sp. AR1]|nr:hypothetical protein [Candidatus Electrothrix sp. AR1]